VLQEKNKTMTAPKPRPRQSKQLDAGGFQPEISSFRLHLAFEGKAGETVRTYTEAVQWFAPPCATRPASPAGKRSARRASSGGLCRCWTGTAVRTPATSTAPSSSSSSGLAAEEEVLSANSAFAGIKA
jgi:hypothetical protein